MIGIRFVDRDMVVRYHWGFGVGHVYSRWQGANRTAESSRLESPHSSSTTSNSEATYESIAVTEGDTLSLNWDRDPDTQSVEFGFENGDDDLGEADSEDPGNLEHRLDAEDDDDLFADLYDMYGDRAFDIY
jgi:hypothetical protein